MKLDHSVVERDGIAYHNYQILGGHSQSVYQLILFLNTISRNHDIPIDDLQYTLTNVYRNGCGPGHGPDVHLCFEVKVQCAVKDVE